MKTLLCLENDCNVNIKWVTTVRLNEKKKKFIIKGE